jgi:oxygen-independent coproporphyrinogen-3 oxidase
LTYWDNAEYYGIGAGASGYLAGVRYKNHGPVHHYLESENKRVTEEKLTVQAQMEEEMFLGLRKGNGVSITRFDEKFEQKFNQVYGKVFRELQKTGLIHFDGDRISLTERGFELGNEVFEKFLIS